MTSQVPIGVAPSVCNIDVAVLAELNDDQAAPCNATIRQFPRPFRPQAWSRDARDGRRGLKGQAGVPGCCRDARRVAPRRRARAFVLLARCHVATAAAFLALGTRPPVQRLAHER